MTIPSLYISGDDEEELFRLTTPDEHPDSSDDSIARMEEESLARGNYEDIQDESDESAEQTFLEVALLELSEDEAREVFQLIEEIQNRRDSGGDE